MGVDSLDNLGRLSQPCLESLLVLLSERPGLIAYLPGEYGRVIPVSLACDCVGARDYVHHVAAEHAHGRVGLHEVGDIVHVFVVAGHTGQWYVTVTCPFEILRVAAAPFPGIVQIKHSLHIPLAQLHQEIVQSAEKGVVVLARSILKGRLYFSVHSAIAVRADQHAQVAHSHGAQAVQLAGKTLPVTSAAFRGQNRSVPEVRTYKIIRFFVLDELAVFYPYDAVAAFVYTGENHRYGQNSQHGYG